MFTDNEEERRNLLGSEECINFRPSPNFKNMRKYLKSKREETNSSPNQSSDQSTPNSEEQEAIESMQASSSNMAQRVYPPLPPNSPPPELAVPKQEIEDKEQASKPPKIMCRQFVRGRCVRASCIFAHEIILEQLSAVYTFCKNFQNSVCKLEKCKFVHASVFEREHFYRTGYLPPHTLLHLEESNCNQAPVYVFGGKVEDTQAYSNPAPVSQPYSNTAPVSQPYSNTAPVSQPYSNPAPVSQSYSNPPSVSQQYSNPPPVSQPYFNPPPFSQSYNNTPPFSKPYSNPPPVCQPYSNTLPVSQPGTSSFSMNGNMPPESRANTEQFNPMASFKRNTASKRDSSEVAGNEHDGGPIAKKCIMCDVNELRVQCCMVKIKTLNEKIANANKKSMQITKNEEKLDYVISLLVKTQADPWTTILQIAGRVDNSQKAQLVQIVKDYLMTKPSGRHQLGAKPEVAEGYRPSQ